MECLEQFVDEIVDFGTAGETHVDGVARVELISPNIVRVSFYARHRGPNGKIENRIVQHLDWDKHMWCEAIKIIETAQRLLLGNECTNCLVANH